MDARHTIGASALGMDQLNLLAKHGIILVTLRWGASQPRIVTAGGDLQYTAHRGDRELGLVRLHEREDLGAITLVS